MSKKKTSGQPCQACKGSRSIPCPTCQGTGGPRDDACCACNGAGEVQCFRCGGTGLEPTATTKEATGSERVDLPWGQARIIEVVNIAWSHHGPSIELLEFPDGKRALRFAAFSEGNLVPGPLVLEAEAIPHLARAAAASRPIQTLLKQLAGGVLAPDFEGVRTAAKKRPKRVQKKPTPRRPAAAKNKKKSKSKPKRK